MGSFLVDHLFPEIRFLEMGRSGGQYILSSEVFSVLFAVLEKLKKRCIPHPWSLDECNEWKLELPLFGSLGHRPGDAEPRLVALASLLADDDTARLVLVVEDLLDVLLFLLVDHLPRRHVPVQQVS